MISETATRPCTSRRNPAVTRACVRYSTVGALAGFSNTHYPFRPVSQNTACVDAKVSYHLSRCGSDRPRIKVWSSLRRSGFLFLLQGAGECTRRLAPDSHFLRLALRHHRAGNPESRRRRSRGRRAPPRWRRPAGRCAGLRGARAWAAVRKRILETNLQSRVQLYFVL